MKRLIVLAALSLTAACGSSVEVISSEPRATGGRCNVVVYQTRGQAEARGPIEEMCVINGSTSGSFRHTISNAIERHKDKACDCGASNVFVESRSDTGLSVATVTLIAFRYADATEER